jgi:hypothetical protein
MLIQAVAVTASLGTERKGNSAGLSCRANDGLLTQTIACFMEESTKFNARFIPSCKLRERYKSATRVEGRDGCSNVRSLSTD